MKYYLSNPLANNGIELKTKEGIELTSCKDMDFPKFFDSLKEGDEVVLVGGDGTINRFANDMRGYDIKNNVYLLGNGSGNDFLNDINRSVNEEVLLNDYLKNLPTVRVNGMERVFLNDMGLGIDGYCCEEADRIKAVHPNKKINYTAIAIKGLLFKFKPFHVDITVDGKDYSFDNAWLAPTMKGRYYGGGMMVAPGQDRKSGLLSVIVYSCKSKLKSLMVFPEIFEGKHVARKDMVTVLTGKKVHVKVSRPCAAQIDGDTILNVSEYDAWQ